MSTPPEQPAPRPCVCTTVKATSRQLARIYDGALHDTPLNVTQLAVLRAIAREKDAPLSRIADGLSMDRTSLYRAVSAMEDRGWVVTAAGRDARSRTAVVTRAGHRALAAAAPSWDRVQQDIVDAFGLEAWQSLVAELRRLRDVAAASRSETSS